MIVHDLSAAEWWMRAVGAMALTPRAVRTAVYPGRVPGSVHSDLMRAGIVRDPRIGFDEKYQWWVGETDWEYRAKFRTESDLLAHDRIDLVCECLDTVAEVSLNGRPIGTAANMFHPHRFDVRGVMNQPGADNELVILFRSPLEHVRSEQTRLGKRPFNGDGLGWSPFNFIRKTACNFGWDWAPKVPTCGPIGPIRLEGWSEVRIASIRPLVARTPSTSRWNVDVHVQLEWSGGSVREPAPRVCAMLLDCDTNNCIVYDTPTTGQNKLCLSTEIENPPLWNPRQPGGPDVQPWWVLIVDACRKEGDSVETIDSCTSRLAFREVRLNTEPDEQGERFQIEINGQPVFCKGANWIPDGLFPQDRTPEKIRQRVRQAADANMNMLRVWGGGAYECDAFYEECDRLGIMVWQDFMFACACYPEEAPYPALIEAEARHQIARLSAHPSLVLWCGGNECVWGFESWGYTATDSEGPWKTRVGEKTWGAGYWFDLLPRLVRELDPTRPYWANSPFAGKCAEHPNQETRGDRHTWDASPGSEAFRKIAPRFCAEFGQQSPPSLELLRKVIAPEDLVVGSRALEERQRGTGGMAVHIDKNLAGLPPAKNFEELHRMSQEAQAAALRAGIEWLASSRPRCMGALIWQLNDAWPGFSWSLIDSEGVPKPAYEAVREAFGKIQP